MKISSILITLILIFKFEPSAADVELSVRSDSTSETEFQALARAHGRNAFSDRILKSSDLLISEELRESFQQRLAEAQREWLANGTSTKAMDQFLDLEHLADWPADERMAFKTFSDRREKVRPKTEASKSARRALTSPLPPLPEDVVFVLVNGEPVPKGDFSSLSFSKFPVRVTLISNVFAPASVTLGETESNWPEFKRRPWISEDCSHYLPPEFSVRFKLVALGIDRCSRVASGLKTTDDPKKEINFGLVTGTGDHWPVQEETVPLIRKPWFWGVVGAVVIGAAIAIERSQNPSTVRPSHSESW